MFEALATFLGEVISNLRMADLIDIVIVAGFLFLVISWMRQSTSRGTVRRVAVVMVFFLALYLPARVFDMYLIGRVAEVFFIAFILAMVVVFQSDLRRMIDRTGAWIFSGSKAVAESSPADKITEAVAHMAEAHTGALIAIRGHEPWGRYVQGGIDLGGMLSPPLLYSIFDHSTPGHDGALLIEGDRIVKFAAHLPLASDVPTISRYGGTRHAAALGLAERCDALVIVVSEERGTISIAQHGALEEVPSTRKLKDRVDTFWKQTYGDGVDASRGWIGAHSIPTAVVSVLLASLLWLAFAYSPGTSHRTYEVPIAYRNVPSDWMIEESIQWAEVTLSGPEQHFRLVDAERLAIELDLADPEEGWNEFAIERDHLNLPARLSLETVEPRTVRVRAHPMTRVTLAVSVPTEGSLPGMLQLVSLRAEPDSVAMLVPENGTSFREIVVESVALQEVTQDTTLTRQLVPAEDMRFPEDGQNEVLVHINVEPPAASVEVEEGDE